MAASSFIRWADEPSPVPSGPPGGGSSTTPMSWCRARAASDSCVGGSRERRGLAPNRSAAARGGDRRSRIGHRLRGPAGPLAAAGGGRCPRSDDRAHCREAREEQGADEEGSSGAARVSGVPGWRTSVPRGSGLVRSPTMFDSSEASAEIRGPSLIVRLPLWQMLLFIGGGATVVLSVWVTNRDLGIQVAALHPAVAQLSASIDELSGATQTLRERMLRIETLNEMGRKP